MIFLGSPKSWNQVFNDKSDMYQYLQFREQSYNLSRKSTKKH